MDISVVPADCGATDCAIRNEKGDQTMTHFPDHDHGPGIISNVTQDIYKAGAPEADEDDKPTAFGPFGDDLEARVLAVHAELDAAIADAREHLGLLEAVRAKVIEKQSVTAGGFITVSGVNLDGVATTERVAIPPGLSKLGRKQLAATGVMPTAALFEEVPRKRVRKPAKASGADSRAMAMAMAKRMDAAMKAPKVAKAVRNGKSRPAAGTLGAKVLAEMAHPAFDGRAMSITKQLGVKPAAVQGQLNN